MTSNTILEKATHNTLELLERMAADANLKIPTELAKAIEQADVNFVTKALIKSKDSQTLMIKLKLDGKVISGIVYPAEEEDEQEEQQEDSTEENKLATA